MFKIFYNMVKLVYTNTTEQVQFIAAKFIKTNEYIILLIIVNLHLYVSEP